jgi:peptidoglycan/LPS O-acetylase OafA/YrhL
MRWLSDASYSIYLWHIFFVDAAAELVPPPFREIAFLPIAIPWLAGLLGSISLVAAVQALLGRRSRDWIGA